MLPCFKYSIIDLADERRIGEAAHRAGRRDALDPARAVGRAHASPTWRRLRPRRRTRCSAGRSTTRINATAARTGKPTAQPDLQVIVELIHRVDNEEPIEKLENTLKRDPSLAFKLLRYINSPAFGLRVEISSFRHAIMLLGYQRLKRWLALLLATASKDVNLRPVMFAAVRRGLLMEELVAGSGDEEMRSEMFICGVFSLLDRMFQASRSPSCSARSRCPSASTRRWSRTTGPYQPYLAMVQAAEGESVFDYPRGGRAAADERRRDQPRAAARPAWAPARSNADRAVRAPAGACRWRCRLGGGPGDARRSSGSRRSRRRCRTRTSASSTSTTPSSPSPACARDALIGRDSARAAARRRTGRRAASGASACRRRGGRADAPALSEGPARRCRRAATAGTAPRAASSTTSGGEPLYLAVLQDTTSEHAARERADRSVRELDDWFDLSPVGMVLFDDSGLLVRTNPAFDADGRQRAGVARRSADPSLARAARLGRGRRAAGAAAGLAADRVAGLGRRSPAAAAPPARDRPLLPHAPAASAATWAWSRTAASRRSATWRRSQIGAMMDTAGVGIATFQESSGWVRPAAGGARRRASALLQNISRDIVAPESLPEYERLQQALQAHAERAEVRYAVDHPELGQRWLLTRVEPATLASGKRTTSVVTLDVTDQQRSQRRSEQLLREMTTILESTTAGIAYLRGDVLVRCNRRFEAMLRLPPSAVAGVEPGRAARRAIPMPRALPPRSARR